MTYFVWQQDKKQVGRFAHFDKEPAGYEVTDWDSGTRSKKPLPTLSLMTNEAYTTELSDLLLARFDLEVFSPKLVAALQECGVKNIDYYPAQVVDHESGDVDNSYQSANIVGKIACLDEDNSEVEYFEEDNTIMDVEEFSLYEDKIFSTPDMKCDPLIFRLAEVESIILVHSSVRDHIEAAGSTGIKFTAPESYIGI